MFHDLDLTRRHWTKTRGPITAIGTWVRLEGRFEPCMVLIRAGSELSDRLIPCVIPMSRAWVWSEDLGDPVEAANTTFLFAQALGINFHDQRSVFAIATLIHDQLGELLSIPPYQPDNLPTVAEAILTNHSTGRTVETEMTDV